jgi:enamine deaminase RidA (YjgF/YER057c/UK114 family)
MKTKLLTPDWSWPKRFGFAPGYRSGDTIYTCGLIAFDREGKLVGAGDCYAQAMQVFANMRELLALEGATMNDILKITAYLPDMGGYQGYARARRETFPNGAPASTTVGSALVLPELLVEIEAIAVLGRS